MMFETIEQMRSIAKAADLTKAVCASVALGGWPVEGYQSRGRGFVEVVGPHSNEAYQAELTPQQFSALSRATDWSVCGAQSADDARIVRAAIDSLKVMRLDWQQARRDGTLNSVSSPL
jgi:hypothetical protein